MGEALERGLSYLLGVQDPATGCFGVPNSHRAFLYDHVIATLAVVEAYDRWKDPRLKRPAQEALAFAQACRNEGGGWRYSYPPDGSSDASVTTWMLLALKSGESCGLEVDPRATRDGLLLLEQLTDAETWRTGYASRGGFSARYPGCNERSLAAATEAMTASALLARLVAGRESREGAAVQGASGVLGRSPPAWEEESGRIDYYYWYVGTLAMYELGGSSWPSWRAALVDAAVPTQRLDGDERGSWDPQFDPWGHIGGRIYSTALVTMCLQLCHDAGDLIAASR